MTVMQRHCRIAVPGLSIKRDFTAARERLLADFPNIHEVVATTAAATLLVLYSGPEDVDAWLDALLDSVATREVTATSRLLCWHGGSLGGDDSAA
jgi:hypothetical protein